MATYKYGEEKESWVNGLLLDGEYALNKKNRADEDAEFDSYIDLLDSVREPKQYDWMSDVRLPEFVSHVLTQASIDADQYFKTRDFVEAYLEDASDEAKANADAAKECINRTLNQRHLYHYQKYMRGKLINNLVGRVYVRCWWEKQTKEEIVGQKEAVKPLDIDIYGNPMVDDSMQKRAYDRVMEPVTAIVPVIDRFNYDIVDSRNVVTDNTYVYSIQEKKFVYIRTEASLQSLKADAPDMGYFNLEVLEELSSTGETETSKETYNSGRTTAKYEKGKALDKEFDLIERFGKFWCVVTKTDENGYALEGEIGVDDEGQPKEGAQFIETIIAWAVSTNCKVMVRFQPNPFRDFSGVVYRPLIRGLCYIHPLSDGGMGDGKHVRELQLAMDDTFNVGQDRVLLATIPTLITKKYESEDNPDIFIEPGHRIPLENPHEDINWLDIKDDIGGALSQIQLLRNMMQQTDAVFPTTMGDVPGLASTTATAVAGAESRTDKRLNYKSLTYENTFLTELYWMILQMTWQFAHPDTGFKLMGDKVYAFDPAKDYFYKPVSQSIDTEYAKASKIKLLIQILGFIVNVQHPDTVRMFNYLLVQMLKYMGDEFSNFAGVLLDPNKPIQAENTGTPEGINALPVSNQAGTPMPAMEQAARANVMGE